MFLLFLEEHYRDQLSILMKQLVILNEIVFLSMKRNDCLYSDLPNGKTVRNTDTKNSYFNSAEERKVRVLQEEDNSVSILRRMHRRSSCFFFGGSSYLLSGVIFLFYFICNYRMRIQNILFASKMQLNTLIGLSTMTSPRHLGS